jgi:hypothetical protein
MKIVQSLIAATLLAVAASSEATIIAYDDFSYQTPVKLSGQNGGTGWGSAWGAISPGPNIVDPDTNLVDNSALGFFNQNNPNLAVRSLASSFSGNQVFVDFYLQIDNGSLTNNDFLAFWFDSTLNPGNADHTSRPNFGIKADIGSSTNNSHLDKTYHIVALLSKTTGNYNQLDLWLNPLVTELSTPDLRTTGNSGLASFDKIGFRSANLDTGDSVLIDNLRLSTTWNEAMNIPEPATLALLGIGFAGIGLRARKA